MKGEAIQGEATGGRACADKPFAPACERNRGPILEVLRRHFDGRRRVLEIGSGTGQHAVHFAAAMPWLSWQCSDLGERLPGIRAWLDEAGLPNAPPPLALDLADAGWPRALDAGGPGAGGAARFDAAFSANVLHIVAWPLVESLFAGLDAALADDATLAVYGPFNYRGEYSSASNREFDAWLRARDPASGIRDFEAVDALARAIGFRLVDDVAMPANNRTLVWRRQ
jgi:SAM-dependent methyltransferase